MLFSMPIPVRCFSCGRVVLALWPAFIRAVQLGYTEQEAFAQVNLAPSHYCCRAILLTSVDECYKRAVETGPAPYTFVPPVDLPTIASPDDIYIQCR